MTKRTRVPADVAIVRCRDYETQNIFQAVRRSADLLGGISSIVKPGSVVLIKPNLLKARSPQAAVTTHPEIVRAAIRLVHAAGGRAVVGDSPGIGDIRSVCERTGIRAVLEQEGAVLADFDDVVTVKGVGRFQRFEIARCAVEADAIINLPKLKTHGMTVITGAIKNLFVCVPGKRKVQWHFKTGVDQGSFCRMLIELAVLLKPCLTIVDAVTSMEGNGPGSGDPRDTGLVIAGRDPVAVDAVVGAVVGVSADRLPVIRAAAALGYGETSLIAIPLHGETIADVRVKGFRLPPQDHLEWTIPEWAQRRLKDALTTRPVIDHHRCVHCGICRNDCPQQAITEDARNLRIDYRNCIRCFCCQEFCPQGAITVARGWALKLVGSRS